MVKQNTKKDSCLQLCLERKETKVIFIVSTYLLRMSGSLLSMPAHTHTHTHYSTYSWDEETAAQENGGI